MSDAVQRQHVQQLIPVEHRTFGIDQHQAVGIAVQRDPIVCLLGTNRLDQRMGRRGTEAGVDVEAVGRTPDAADLRTQLVKHRRGDLIRSPMGSIHHHPHALEREFS